MFRNRLRFAIGSPFLLLIIIRVQIHSGSVRTFALIGLLVAATVVMLQGWTTARSAINFCSGEGVATFGVCEVTKGDYQWLYEANRADSPRRSRAKTSRDLVEDTDRGRLAWRVVSQHGSSGPHVFEVAGAGTFRLVHLLTLAIEKVPSTLGIHPIRGELVELPRSEDFVAAAVEPRAELTLYVKLLGDAGD